MKSILYIFIIGLGLMFASCSEDDSLETEMSREEWLRLYQAYQKDSADSRHYMEILNYLCSVNYPDNEEDTVIVINSTYGDVLSSVDTTQRYTLVLSAEDAESEFIDMLDFATGDKESIIEKEGTLFYDMGSYGSLTFHRNGRHQEEAAYVDVRLKSVEDFTILSYQYYIEDETNASVERHFRRGAVYQSQSMNDTLWLCIREFNSNYPSKLPLLVALGGKYSKTCNYNNMYYFYDNMLSDDEIQCFIEMYNDVKTYRNAIYRFLYPLYYDEVAGYCKGANALKLKDDTILPSSRDKITLFYGSYKVSATITVGNSFGNFFSFLNKSWKQYSYNEVYYNELELAGGNYEKHSYTLNTHETGNYDQSSSFVYPKYGSSVSATVPLLYKKLKVSDKPKDVNLKQIYFN